MPKLNSQSAERFGFNNMRSERIKNVGTPKLPNDGMTFAVPNMTTASRNLMTPALGMVIYNVTTNKLNVYTGSWEEITSS